MKKIIFIIVILLVVAIGVGLYFYDTRAQEAQLDFQVVNAADGRSATLSWINPELKFAKIKIYQSNDKNKPGLPVATVEEVRPGEISSVKIENLIPKQLYYFTAIGEKPSGHKITLGQIADGLVQYPTDLIFTAQDSSGRPLVRIYGGDRRLINEFYPFEKDYLGTIDISRLDIDGDGVDEVAAAPAYGSSLVKIFKQDGGLISAWSVYEAEYKSGLNIAAIEVENFDVQRKYFAVGPKNFANQKHKIKIYRYDDSVSGKFAVQDEILAFENFNGGVNLAAADFNGDGRQELAVTPIGGAAQVKIFNFCSHPNQICAMKYGSQRFSRPDGVFDQIYPFGKIEKQDLKVSAFDLDRDGKDELIVYPLSGRTTILKIYDCEIHDEYRCLAKEIEAKQIYGDRYQGGINVSTFEGRENFDRYILVSPQSGGGPHLKLYQWDKKLKLINEFFAYDQEFSGGVETMAFRRGESIEIASVPQKMGGPHVKIFEPVSGKMIEQFFAFDQSFARSLMVR